MRSLVVVTAVLLILIVGTLATTAADRPPLPADVEPVADGSAGACDFDGVSVTWTVSYARAIRGYGVDDVTLSRILPVCTTGTMTVRLFDALGSTLAEVTHPPVPSPGSETVMFPVHPAVAAAEVVAIEAWTSVEPSPTPTASPSATPGPLPTPVPPWPPVPSATPSPRPAATGTPAPTPSLGPSGPPTASPGTGWSPTPPATEPTAWLAVGDAGAVGTLAPGDPFVVRGRGWVPTCRPAVSLVDADGRTWPLGTADVHADRTIAFEATIPPGAAAGPAEVRFDGDGSSVGCPRGVVAGIVSIGRSGMPETATLDVLAAEMRDHSWLVALAAAMGIFGVAFALRRVRRR